MSTLDSFEIQHRDVYPGTHVVRAYGDGVTVGVITAVIGYDSDDDPANVIHGPRVRVAWHMDHDMVWNVETEALAGDLRRVGRRLHWNGDPDGCAADCEGAHYGDHLAPGAVCDRCGGSARGCYTGSAGQGCAFSGRGSW